MKELDRQVVDAEFEELGDAATYSPAVGEDASCQIRFATDEDIGVSISEFSSPVARSTLLFVRAWELSPAVGGVFSLESGDRYKVVGEPRLTDPARLVWSCKVDVIHG
ncbi:conserved hypothetical protein [Roseibium sp. TrichSKD4]|uniref:head-tail joining protein n=1 Tax=Roseibium sp. TrichSKD4 TaxID=744980 RepID=UPI0001E56389|nr:hypothetical protein [Roseibium sp. TrichSKD4]EFO33907.1 conserved hypothetical protein [Roseibium sp. TrichSKD4]